MHTDHAFFPYGETEEVQILELPYRAGESGGECSMVILLPKPKVGYPISFWAWTDTVVRRVGGDGGGRRGHESGDPSRAAGCRWAVRRL